MEILSRVSPFVFLPRGAREKVGAAAKARTAEKGEVITRAGDAAESVFIVCDGHVEALRSLDAQPLSTIEAGQYFGERAVLFERPRGLFTRAAAPCELLELPARVFLEMVDSEPAFRSAIADALRHTHGIFSAYQRLRARVMTLISRGDFTVSDLVDAYRDVRPALHPGVDDEHIDIGALGYAVARLPSTITHTSFIYCCTSLPVLYHEDVLTELVYTRARRRAGWQVLPGKLVTLLRDNLTDPLDLITCLCLYSVEARKIRRRVERADTLATLARAPQEAPAQREALSKANFSDDEREGLLKLWPDAARRVHDMVMHHEDIGVECDLVAKDYTAVASERWVAQIRAQAAEMVDIDDDALEVHIVSSNTHSVSNCLSPFLGRRQADILAWGKLHHPEIDPAQLPNERDLLYVLARAYDAAEPAARELRMREERAAGHYRLISTAFTGIAVDLFDLRRCDPALADPGVKAKAVNAPRLLINVDYAFGQQAERILAGLLYLFGKRVRSLNVLGKAGGLVGARGDVLLARATLLQENDEVYNLSQLGAPDLDPSLVAELLPNRTVHEGLVLTVAGTLLQDTTLLHYYRRLFGCIGLEMEGSYFARQLHASAAADVVRDDIALRFAYYTSDLPLSHGDNLSASMSAYEGVPPLYALTRAVLRRVFACS